MVIRQFGCPNFVKIRSTSARAANMPECVRSDCPGQLLLEPKVRDYQAWLRLEANFLATRHVHFLKQIIAKEHTVTAAESAYKTLFHAEVEAMQTWEVQDIETKDFRSKLQLLLPAQVTETADSRSEVS